MPISLSTYLFICRSIYLCIYLSACLSVCLSICPQANVSMNSILTQTRTLPYTNKRIDAIICALIHLLIQSQMDSLHHIRIRANTRTEENISLHTIIQVLSHSSASSSFYGCQPILRFFSLLLIESILLCVHVIDGHDNSY